MTNRAKLYLVTAIALLVTLVLVYFYVTEYFTWMQVHSKWEADNRIIKFTEEPEFGYGWLAVLAAVPGIVAAFGCVWAFSDFAARRDHYDQTGRWPDTDLFNPFDH